MIQRIPLFLVSASIFAGSAAYADASPDAPNATHAARALVLSVEQGSPLDAERARAAIEHELGTRVVLSDRATPADRASAGELRVGIDRARVATLSYRDPEGRVLTRSVSLPPTDERALEVISLLAGNLARDEALDLLAEPHRDEVGQAAVPDRAKGASPSSDAPMPPPDLRTRPSPAVDLSLYWPVSLMPDSDRHVVNFELGAAYSRVGAIEGLGLNLFVLHVNQYVHGAAISTLWSHDEGPSCGLVMSALVHDGGGTLRGAEIAGVLNVRRGATSGLRLSGVVDMGGGVDGLAAAAAVNIADDLHGVQLSAVDLAQDVSGLQGAVAVAVARDVRGAQLSVVGLARDVEGVELAAGVNVARDVAGLQLGVVNIGRDVHGLQLGVVNIADHVDGASFGLASIAGNGRIQPVAWASTYLPVNVGVRFQVGHFYSQLGSGLDETASTGERKYAPDVGIGARIDIGRLFIDPGVHFSEQHAIDPWRGDPLRTDLHYRAALGIDFGKVSVFAGGGVVHQIIQAYTLEGEAFAGLMLF